MNSVQIGNGNGILLRLAIWEEFRSDKSIINYRPLTVQLINDVDSPAPLCPMNILTMKTKVVLPSPGKFPKKDLYVRKRWRRVQHIGNEF